MLRRLTVFLRRGLFVVGVVLLVCIPVSYFYALVAQSPWPRTVNAAALQDGRLSVFMLELPGGRGTPALLSFHRRHADLPNETSLLRPTWDGSYSSPLGVLPLGVMLGPLQSPSKEFVEIVIPLWMLAAICLAWPVTSFFLHRRRRGRGFPVETVEGLNAEG